MTVLEIITVVAVVVVLVWMALPAIGGPRSHPVKVRTVTVLNEIDAACSQYRAIYGVYPDTVAGADGGSMQAVFMHGGQRRPAVAISTVEWDAVSAQLMQLLANVDRDHFSAARWPLGRITDAWGGTIRYRPARYYPCDGSSALAIDGRVPPHADSFQLWSPGADGVDRFGAAGSDDLTNWQ